MGALEVAMVGTRVESVVHNLPGPMRPPKTQTPLSSFDYAVLMARDLEDRETRVCACGNRKWVEVNRSRLRGYDTSCSER